MHDVLPGLWRSSNSAHERACPLCAHAYTKPHVACQLNTNLYLDGVRIPEATSIGGLGNGATWAGFYGTNTGTYMSTLAAGDHTVKIMYRTDNSIAVSTGNVQATKGIQILVL